MYASVACTEYVFTSQLQCVHEKKHAGSTCMWLCRIYMYVTYMTSRPPSWVYHVKTEERSLICWELRIQVNIVKPATISESICFMCVYIIPENLQTEFCSHILRSTYVYTQSRPNDPLVRNKNKTPWLGNSGTALQHKFNIATCSPNKIFKSKNKHVIAFCREMRSRVPRAPARRRIVVIWVTVHCLPSDFLLFSHCSCLPIERRITEHAILQTVCMFARMRKHRRIPNDIWKCTSDGSCIPSFRHSSSSANYFSSVG